MISTLNNILYWLKKSIYLILKILDGIVTVLIYILKEIINCFFFYVSSLYEATFNLFKERHQEWAEFIHLH